MIDKEKIINELQQEIDRVEYMSERYPDPEFEVPAVVDVQLLRDALELLKEQESVKMNRARADIFMGYDVASCPKCNCRWIMHHDQDLNYCPRCGVRVEWE